MRNTIIIFLMLILSVSLSSANTGAVELQYVVSRTSTGYAKGPRALITIQDRYWPWSSKDMGFTDLGDKFQVKLVINMNLDDCALAKADNYQDWFVATNGLSIYKASPTPTPTQTSTITPTVTQTFTPTVTVTPSI